MVIQDVSNEALTREMEDAETQLAALEKQRLEIVKRIEECHQAIVGYRNVIAFRANRKEPLPPKMLPGFGQNGIAAKPSSAGRTPGNRASDMPQRSDEFKNVSVEKAFIELGYEWRVAHHADNYVRRVWRITTERDLARAKRTGNSAFFKLAKRGAMKKVSPNTWEPVMTDNMEVAKETSAAR